VTETAPDDVWIQGDVLLHIAADGGFDPVCLSSPPMPCVNPRSQSGSCGPFVPTVCDSTTVNISGRGLWASGASRVWAGNNLGSVMQLTDAGWTSWNTADNRAVTALFGSGPSDVWGIDALSGYSGHYDGVGWTHVGACTGNALWQSDTTHVWTAEASGIGAGTQPCGAGELTSPSALRGIWGSGPDDVWAVGVGGTLVHRHANVWATVNSPTTKDLNAVWGCSSSNVWAVGAQGTLLHYDGSQWSAVTVPTTNDLNGVSGLGNDSWVTGAGGMILRLR
jgi:hypothetical protein